MHTGYRAELVDTSLVSGSTCLTVKVIMKQSWTKKKA